MQVTAAAIFIVIQQAAESGIRISFLEHAAIGIPVTLLSLSVLLVWLGLMGAF